MPKYIYTRNGVEVRREEKGRGRTKSGAILRADGNWEIKEDHVVPAVPAPKSDAPAVAVSKSDDNAPAAVSPPKINKIHASSTIGVSEFLKKLHMSMGYTEEDDKITIMQPMVMADNIIKNWHSPYSVYAKIVLDIKENNILIWTMDDKKNDPDLIVLGGLA